MASLGSSKTVMVIATTVESVRLQRLVRRRPQVTYRAPPGTSMGTYVHHPDVARQDGVAVPRQVDGPVATHVG